MARIIGKRFARPPAATPPQPLPTQQPDRSSPQSVWFWRHYEEAARDLIDFMAGSGLSLTGREVADIGCGDGILDLGLFHKARPARLCCYDLHETNRDLLLVAAAREGVASELPAGLEFAASGETMIPAEDQTFDYVVSWSAFEHICNPVGVLREVNRVLRDDGVLFIQLWPFYFSEHGAHLWEWFPEGFPHLNHSRRYVEEYVRSHSDDPAWADMMLTINLNRITLDDLHRCLLASGFRIARLEILTNCLHVPAELAYLPPSMVGITGVKLTAVRLETAPRLGHRSPA